MRFPWGGGETLDLPFLSFGVGGETPEVLHSGETPDFLHTKVPLLQGPWSSWAWGWDIYAFEKRGGPFVPEVRSPQKALAKKPDLKVLKHALLALMVVVAIVVASVGVVVVVVVVVVAVVIVVVVVVVVVVVRLVVVIKVVVVIIVVVVVVVAVLLADFDISGIEARS